MESFQAVVPDWEFSVFPAHKGVLPGSEECDAFLLTGSRHSAYDELDWIPPLESLIRQLFQEKKKLLGVCFGHQIMAQALGGVVTQSEKGWGVGLSFNQVKVTKPWMEPVQSQLDLLVSHQDQVMTPPESAEIVASSEFCPNFVVQYGPSFLSVQGHPEFSKAYTAALMGTRRGQSIPEERYQAGITSMNNKVDSELMIRWMVNFILL